ncbi:MAG: peroxiredoxin [Phycisphaerales bacterium]
MGVTGHELIGRAAPRLRLRDATGAEFDLAALWPRKPSVVYFYPKAGTAGCTAEACAFRDAYEAFTQMGAEVVGVSSDSVQELAEFARTNRLPFVLLSDEDGRARREWGVPKDLLVLPGRVTYVVDREGIVRGVFRSAVKMREHAEEAMRLVRGLAGSPTG